MRFYDSRNDQDLARVEGILRKGGIECFLRQSGTEDAMQEIHVAEEDVSWAEELLEQTHRHH